MDATTAALIGAGIGVSGTVVAPIITSWQGRQAKREELKRDAYAAGIQVIAEATFALRITEPDDRVAFFKKLTSALGSIEMHGKISTADHYSEVVEAFESWAKDMGQVSDFSLAAKAFQKAARREIHVDSRWPFLRQRFTAWFRAHFRFGAAPTNQP